MPEHKLNTDVRDPSASVVIPTFNGADRLPRLLAALAAQDASNGSFEVIVVNNASTDDTAKVTERDPSGAKLRQRSIACRTVSEPRQGLTYARICGILAGRGEVVCFLDDDNIPDPDYLSKGTAMFADASLGMVTSQVYPEWEVEPPPSIYRRRHLLAVNDYNGNNALTFTGTIAPTVGAGMWVRREAFLSAIPWRQPNMLISDRSGAGLSSAGDIEFGVLIGKAGYRRDYAPQLRLAHRIPHTRFANEYFRRLITGTIRSELALKVKYAERYSPRDRMAAGAKMILAFCAIPFFPLFMTDWRREAIFVFADRWARVKGPSRESNDSPSSHTETR